MTRRKFYLDKERKKLAGVCAGIADYFDWDVTMVRIAWVVASCFWAPVMITAYVVMAWMVDPKPAPGYSSAMGSGPWPTDPSAPRRRFVDVRDRFDRLESRLRSLETVVTSREFRMDRELRT